MSRIHLVALPHVVLGTDTTCLCAYSGKVDKFIRMMRDRHELIVYGVEGPELPGATLVQCLSENARIAIFGKDERNRLPNWPTDSQSRLFNLSAAAKLAERAKPNELVLLVGGLTHKPITDQLKEFTYCEPFVGYEGIFTNKCAFESYAWMHAMYAKWGHADIRWFDTVVPPFCDAAEFPKLNSGNGDSLAFLGRAISRKGPQIALEIAKAAGMPLWVAGAGWKRDGSKLIGLDVTLEGDTDELVYIGPVNVKERAEFLANARALLVCTTYLEPGGNVAIEAMLAGTPVICPDFGVYSETVRHGVSGFHFRLMREAVDAVKRCDELYPANVRQHAIMNYSLEAIGPRFDKWLDNLTTLFEDGWYQGHKPKTEEKKMEIPVSPDWHEENHPFYEDPENPHLGGYRVGGDEATTYQDLWTWLVNDLKVESVIDVGCGDGVAVRFFETLLPGSVIGIDGVKQDAKNILQHDFTKGEQPNLDDRGSYDLVWCCEFVEHIEEKFIPNFLETFKCNAKYIMMTHAMPGQKGHHHVNCRTPSYWTGVMAAIGYRLDDELTKKTRELAALNTSPHNHFKRSGLAFVRN